MNVTWSIIGLSILVLAIILVLLKFMKDMLKDIKKDPGVQLFFVYEVLGTTLIVAGDETLGGVLLGLGPSFYFAWHSKRDTDLIRAELQEIHGKIEDIKPERLTEIINKLNQLDNKIGELSKELENIKSNHVRNQENQKESKSQ